MPVDVPQYPVNLIVAGRRCLVVGGGSVAARKAEGLLAAEATVHVVATLLGPRVGALARAGAVTAEERAYEPGDLDGVWLAVAATDDPAVNRAVFDEGEARRVWVNAADEPASCSYTLPSVVRQGPLLVTVATGGRSPALATWLRRHVEAELGEEYAVLAEMLSAEREAIRARGGSTEGLDWISAIESGMLELIRQGSIELARERLKACLSSSSA
jgi:precorrin-2 dehydrogenase/sirohydrochlorin ferrochelatase